MKRVVLAAIVLFTARDAFAIDPIGASVNAPLPCKTNGETFFHYGDTWAFLPGGACKGTEPTGVNVGLGVQDPGGKQDLEGHCMWVNFDEQGPIAKTTVTPDAATHAERARKVVFASMLKWAGYKMGKATLGNPEWSCPTPSQTAGSSYVTSQAYDFGTGNVGKPSLNFFRGNNVPATMGSGANRGDESECFAPCKAGQSCSSLTGTPGPSGATFYPCTANLTDDALTRFRYKTVRHNVIWVRGSGAWKAQTQQPPTVLASTEATFWPDNGIIVTADMLFNNENVDWQLHDPENPTNPPAGCDPNSATCYFLETVATHEAGHWIGLGHVACSEAVMVPTASSTEQKYDLSKHELAGVCSIYRPTSEGRYPTKSRQGEGCFSDAQCNGEAGLKCLFSEVSFYDNATALMSAPLASRIPHRGVCVKSAKCTSDDECDKTKGFVCQTVNEATNERYCMVGSPDRPRTLGSVADFCIACDEGAQCNGVCASTAADGMNIKLSSGTPPARMCTVKCEQASGCANGFDCRQVGSTRLCVPLNPDKCIADAQASRAQLNEACGDSVQCGAGLTCVGLLNAAVCLERCTKSQACRTPGYGCVLKIGTGADGKPVELDEGACFKKDMNEGDACTLGSSALCGLDCTGSGTAEKCTPTLGFMCALTQSGVATSAQCFAKCTTNAPAGAQPVACPGSTQSCIPIPNDVFNGVQFGYCSPIAGGGCKRGTGEPCTTTSDCDSDLCQNFGTFSACTNYCDLSNPSFCPTGTLCADIGGGKAACRPTSEPVAVRCLGSSNGCNCRSVGAGDAIGYAFVALALWLRRRAKRR